MHKKLELEDLFIPEVLKHSYSKKTLIAFEGVDACGKSTICTEINDKYSNYKFIKIPEAYITSPFKDYLSFEASKIGNSLIYMASLADREEIVNCLDNTISYVVMDRSLWSTIAINYVKNPTGTQDIINIFSAIYKYIPIPDIVFVLDVPYDICRERVATRTKDAQKYDAMSKKEYNKHMEFYYWLSKQNVGVKIVDYKYIMNLEDTITFIHDSIEL